MVDRVAADPQAIGFTGLGHLKPGVRVVAIAKGDGERAYLPTAATIAADRYPLARTVDLLFAPRPACADATGNFVRYLLGSSGQRVISRSGPFVGLDAATRRVACRNAVLSLDRKTSAATRPW